MIEISKMTGTILALLLLVTVISEVFLLNQNLTLKKEIDAYHQLLLQLQTRQDKITYERSFEGKCLPSFHQQPTAATNGTSQTTNSKFAVIFYFSIEDCTPCLTSEIATWNALSASYDHKLCQVIGVTGAAGATNFEELIRSMNIEFPVINIPNFQNLLTKIGIRSTPAVLFGDLSNKRTIYAFFPTIADKSSAVFTHKLKMLLDACKDQY
jgi:hypothetical protein